MFKCDRCGLCCMNVGSIPLYKDLDRGDGICRFFDCITHLCTIYDIRPIKCNVDLAYDMYFENVMTKEQYYRLNYNECENLKRKDKNVWIFEKEK